MSIAVILSILAIHWFADFVCQTDWQAQNKSKNWDALISHTTNYSFIWALPICIMVGLQLPGKSAWYYVWIACAFVGATFILHTITDYFTSRINAKLWAEKKVHYFFVSIGFDQLLHYTQLFFTYKLLIG